MKSCFIFAILAFFPFVCLVTYKNYTSGGLFEILLKQLQSNDCQDLYAEGLSFKNQYSDFNDEYKTELKERVRSIFLSSLYNYYEYAFPKDELNPIDCKGRGPDYGNPSNININDVLGNYSLTLIDSLDSIAVMGTKEQFHQAVQDVIRVVDFDQDSIVQVFESNIRILGSLLSAHLLLTVETGLGNLTLNGYESELLSMAQDLGTRLLQAFDVSPLGLPHPRVNLRDGVPTNWSAENCLAGAGSFLLEFGLLSRLTGDPVYEWKARRATKALWNMRSNGTGLLGNTFDVETGIWNSKLSGLGAGMDSYYEYLLKSFILFGEQGDLDMFEEAYTTIKKYMRRGRTSCLDGIGDHPLYVNVNMDTGTTHSAWIDALQASFPGVQVLYGDVDEAICQHAVYHAIWRKYGLMPERYNWQLKTPEILFYPLRPEFVESTYLLYQATKHPYYLHVGKEILWSLEQYAKCNCGYCTVHNIIDRTLEDRMESFFLSETCKYLYLLFDENHALNHNAEKFIFTTEGHVIPVMDLPPVVPLPQILAMLPLDSNDTKTPTQCHYPEKLKHRSLPLEAESFVQLFKALNVDV
ncbi:ER degradation-enhancing alpha-mannosidase-like protein 1 isoform X2 [Artemia franciscana]|uniref:alpha-1,2-Mannosidase n=1 Tax=Artemia franciscana TaxID=6661 RepID=A0AA88I3H5_ARTSF|nr:hypothetical protein QYM36_002630 [Artemia franciscana]KAK2722140.1 hypothetical protein QYM36_002630 [Artemia franciscana]